MLRHSFALGHIVHDSFLKTVYKFMSVIMLLPSAFVLFKFPDSVSSLSVRAGSTLLLMENLVIFARCAPKVQHYLRTTYDDSRTCINTYGVMYFAEIQWVRVDIPAVFRAFWSTRFLCTAGCLCFAILSSGRGAPAVTPPEKSWSYSSLLSFKTHDSDHNNNFTHLSHNMFLITTNSTAFFDTTRNIVRTSLAYGCSNVIAMIGMATVVAKIASMSGRLCLSFIQATEVYDHDCGMLAAVMFIILALQTGMTNMVLRQRWLRLRKNSLMICTAMLQYIHGPVATMLLQLTASQPRAFGRHVRPLLMSFAIASSASLLLHYVWDNFPFSTWVFAATIFCAEVMLKVTLSLLQYALFLWDALSEEYWDALDDYIYYLKAFGNVVLFTFGVVLFANGIFILVFESSSSLRALMICFHAYFNIWRQAVDGWRTFMRRQAAVSQINSLPLATELELQQLNDVCSICFQALNHGRKTRCHHFFHETCLRKWLYVKDTCPLCHEKAYGPVELDVGAEVSDESSREAVSEVAAPASPRSSRSRSPPRR